MKANRYEQLMSAFTGPVFRRWHIAITGPEGQIRLLISCWTLGGAIRTLQRQDIWPHPITMDELRESRLRWVIVHETMLVRNPGPAFDELMYRLMAFFELIEPGAFSKKAAV